MVAANQNSGDGWSDEAKAIANKARALYGDKLDQAIRHLQRHSGRSRDSCVRLVVKNRDGHRRWTEMEIEQLRELVATHTVEETAKKLGRSAKSVRCALHRYDLKIREIRCDWFSIDSLAQILHVRKVEIQSWIEKGWLEATIRVQGKRRSYAVTPEAFQALYADHLSELMAQKRIPSVALFEAFYTYCFAPKHTIGSQLLSVRHDKKEREDYAASQAQGGVPVRNDRDC